MPLNFEGSGAGAADGRAAADDRPVPASYLDYCSARERFFERLRIDSEVRRLERAWGLPCREPSPGERGT